LDVQLNFMNKSNDANNSDVVIFQKNMATDAEEIAIAWQVIQYCGQEDNHPFIYPTTFAVGASDSWGNYTPHLPAQNGQLFAMSRTQSGDTLAYFGPATSSTEVQVLNALPEGVISAGVYKAGKLAALKTTIAPGQKAVFQFKPTLWIGVVSQVAEGSVMNSAIVSSINTELSLLGIASADIVMTGGGTGPKATPFEFEFENLVMA
jgi:hypothetical protein